MEKSVLFKSVCKKFENIVEGLSLAHDVKDFDGLVRGFRFYDVFNSPHFCDFFLGSELRDLVRFCSKYKEIDFCIIQCGSKVCFSVTIPFDL